MQVVSEVLEATSFKPPHQLLMDNFVWRKVVWEVLPLTPCAANPQSGIEDFTYRVDALVSVFWSKQKVRQDEEVSFVVQVALVGFSL